MNFDHQRKLKFKAWNSSTGLMMRLTSIECVRGELVKKDYRLLQFTGLVDKNGDELYELDVMMVAGKRYCILWDDTVNGWALKNLSDGNQEPLRQAFTMEAVRLWNHLESAAKQP